MGHVCGWCVFLPLAGGGARDARRRVVGWWVVATPTRLRREPPPAGACACRVHVGFLPLAGGGARSASVGGFAGLWLLGWVNGWLVVGELCWLWCGWWCCGGYRGGCRACWACFRHAVGVLCLQRFRGGFVVWVCGVVPGGVCLSLAAGQLLVLPFVWLVSGVGCVWWFENSRVCCTTYFFIVNDCQSDSRFGVFPGVAEGR
ncbi:hypothetical protein Uis4E_0503 [Bifidobacterium parmae]|uniref:Uncharacterized protein n=1 Tax=Bifidobacterium parmae TaxID=361854 RepID=A0A2N5J540_9BIFI|nr:hypothetical protein Uis4E_0503 [Bifidobacterium parmae]